MSIIRLNNRPNRMCTIKTEVSMQVVIPMSGFGERFRRAGYSVPKPLLKVDGKPIVAHVIDMFPGEKNFIFICNQEHLNEPTHRMKAILKEYKSLKKNV